MSSSSSYTNNYLQHNGDERCDCGRKAVMRPSLTVKNPGRRFLGCVNYKKHNGCNFFVWVDPQTCERGLEYAKIMQAKKEELERQIKDLKMMNNELGRGIQKLEKENDALFVKLAELTEINVKLAGQTGPRKTTNRLYFLDRYKAATIDGGSISTYVRRCNLQQDQWNAFHTWRSLHSSSHSHPFSNNGHIDRTDGTSVAPATVRPTGLNMMI